MINQQPLMRIKLGLGLITLSTLLLELSLIRVLDVILNPVMGYMVITSAMFALGLGGIYVYIFKNKFDNPGRFLPLLSLLYALSALLILPVFNQLPFYLNFEMKNMAGNILSWMGMYISLSAPFFISGILISLLFFLYSSESHGLYFFDLCGAGVGCLLMIPLIPYYGPGGFLFLIAGFITFAGLLFSSWKSLRLLAVAPLLLALILFPLFLKHYIEFKGHGNKRSVDEWIRKGMREYVRWDPVSKLDVFNVSRNAKNFSLDGGQQGSWMQRFDGNYEAYHKRMRETPDSYFFGISSVVHYLNQDKHPNVLIIGAAVGSETKTALIFNAEHVDAIDLVKAMVEAAKGRYAKFSGRVFIHPKVNYITGEGRTFLRSSSKKYDTIQMFSNHTSSSLANGAGVLSSVYLQTAEAYMEYFEHLTDNGILQINHHLYPKMIISAAQGWNRLGRKNFARHVLVMERFIPDNLPTLLIKMRPWKKEEVDRVYQYMNREKTHQKQGLPRGAIPSKKVYHNNRYRGSFFSRVDRIHGISILIGTHGQERLDYPVTLKLYDGNGKLLRTSLMDGNAIGNDKVVDFEFDPIGDSYKKEFWIEILSENADSDKAFSVWLTRDKRPVLQTLPRPPMPAYHIAFHPLKLQQNLIPERFLESPFPKDLARQAEYRMDPVTDNSPHFNMIRKKNKRLNPSKSKYLDGGTAYFLNNQYRRFIPYDWISIVVVGVMSIVFSLIFVVIPFVSTPLGRSRWKNKGLYLAYFSCLGAGFIIIELVFIQVFTKLIGFPTHTFAVVIFALLFSAGVGSMMSKKLGFHENGRWKIIFSGIFLFALLLTLLHPFLFSKLLRFSLPIRIIAAFIMIFPLGFFMGMPFPLGMVHLGKTESSGVPWAWGMNGFFTVFGGYLSLVFSIWFGFRAVLLGGVGIYLLAFLIFQAIQVSQEQPSTASEKVSGTTC